MRYGKQHINSRDLYYFMIWKTKYSNWADREIKALNFKKGKDYFVIREKRASLHRGGKLRNEYYFKLHMVKEIAMRHFGTKARRLKCRQILSFIESITKGGAQ